MTKKFRKMKLDFKNERNFFFLFAHPVSKKSFWSHFNKNKYIIREKTGNQGETRI